MPPAKLPVRADFIVILSRLGRAIYHTERRVMLKYTCITQLRRAQVHCNMRILELRIVSIAFSFLNGMLHIPTSSPSSSGPPFGQLTGVGVNHIWLKFLTRRDEYIQMIGIRNLVVSLQKAPYLNCFDLFLPHFYSKAGITLIYMGAEQSL